MDAGLQLRQAREMAGMTAGSARIRSAKDAALTRSNRTPQRPSTCSTPQTAGTGSPSASTAAWFAASRNATRFAAGER